jgi:DNA-directed RNA polymerase subunit RPC12/RpoP
MAIQFCCTQCGHPIEVDDEYAGQTAACPYCRHVVSVPAQSTYRPDAAISARPVARSAEQPHNLAAETLVAEERRPAIPPPRRRAATTFGTYAFICTLLSLILFGVATATATITLLRLSGGKAPATMNQQQITELQDQVMRKPWFIAAQFGGLFFALAGLVLGIVSLTQVARGNWRGIVSVVVCGLSLLCICASAVFSAATGFGMPSPG